MRFDENNLIVMEQCEFPGSIGDSCAETFRYSIFVHYLVKDQEFSKEAINKALSSTFTTTGFLRHPDAPKGWREEDFTSDQFLPRMITQDLVKADGLSMWSYLENNKFCTDSTQRKLATPGIFAAHYRGQRRPSLFWDAVSILGQVLLFKVPYRWDDGKNQFSPTETSSCDYLNWIILLIQCELLGHTLASRLAKRLMHPDLLKSKVLDYYKPEPNSKGFTDLYVQAIDKMYQVNQEQ